MLSFIWSCADALLAPFLSIPLVASGAAGVVLHVCQSMGGAVVGDCDCEKPVQHGAHADHGEGAKLQAQPCCTVELSSTSELLATQEASVPQIDEALLAPGDHFESAIAQN
jgi:hypothetical protein